LPCGAVDEIEAIGAIVFQDNLEILEVLDILELLEFLDTV
jgi:hypothetical protein